MDIGKQIKALRAALSSGDAQKVARALALPPIASSRQSKKEPSPVPSVNNVKDPYGGDWSSLTGNWLSACQAADAVRTDYYSLLWKNALSNSVSYRAIFLGIRRQMLRIPCVFSRILSPQSLCTKPGKLAGTNFASVSTEHLPCSSTC